MNTGVYFVSYHVLSTYNHQPSERGDTFRLGTGKKQRHVIFICVLGLISDVIKFKCHL